MLPRCCSPELSVLEGGEKKSQKRKDQQTINKQQNPDLPQEFRKNGLISLVLSKARSELKVNLFQSGRSSQETSDFSAGQKVRVRWWCGTSFLHLPPLGQRLLWVIRVLSPSVLVLGFRGRRCRGQGVSRVSTLHITIILTIIALDLLFLPFTLTLDC